MTRYALRVFVGARVSGGDLCRRQKRRPSRQARPDIIRPPKDMRSIVGGDNRGAPLQEKALPVREGLKNMFYASADFAEVAEDGVEEVLEEVAEEPF